MKRDIFGHLYTRFLLIFILIFSHQNHVFTQIKSAPLTREIIVAKNDSVIRSSILVNNPDIKILNLVYFWYYNDDIKSNVGGFGGDLLHGGYIVYDKENNMAVKGNFFNGVKNGLWKYWYPNGKVRMEISWSEGNLDGICNYYNYSGLMYKSEKYKKNKLQEVTSYDHAGVITNTIAYKDGKIKENKKDNKESKSLSEDKKPLLKLFTFPKKEKEEENFKVEDSPEEEKKSFIRLPKFSKKDNEETLEF